MGRSVHSAWFERHGITFMMLFLQLTISTKLPFKVTKFVILFDYLVQLQISGALVEKES